MSKFTSSSGDRTARAAASDSTEETAAAETTTGASTTEEDVAAAASDSTAEASTPAPRDCRTSSGFAFDRVCVHCSIRMPSSPETPNARYRTSASSSDTSSCTVEQADDKSSRVTAPEPRLSNIP